MMDAYEAVKAGLLTKDDVDDVDAVETAIAVKRAILVERERCLKYCAQWEASARLNLCVNAVGVASAIASDIRSGE